MKHIFLCLCDGLIAHFLLFIFFCFLAAWTPCYEDVMAVQSLLPHTSFGATSRKKVSKQNMTQANSDAQPPLTGASIDHPDLWCL